jgi:hypothetical protein
MRGFSTHGKDPEYVEEMSDYVKAGLANAHTIHPSVSPELYLPKIIKKTFKIKLKDGFRPSYVDIETDPESKQKYWKQFTLDLIATVFDYRSQPNETVTPFMFFYGREFMYHTISLFLERKGDEFIIHSVDSNDLKKISGDFDMMELFTKRQIEEYGIIYSPKIKKELDKTIPAYLEVIPKVLYDIGILVPELNEEYKTSNPRDVVVKNKFHLEFILKQILLSQFHTFDTTGDIEGNPLLGQLDQFGLPKSILRELLFPAPKDDTLSEESQDLERQRLGSLISKQYLEEHENLSP